MRIKKTLRIVAGLFLLLTVLFTVFAFRVNARFGAVETEPVNCSTKAPLFKFPQEIKVMTWNVQFLAGKGYVFFFDVLDGSGPDTRPDRSAVSATLAEVIRVVREESPDFVLLQEVDEGAKRTDYQDQIALIYQGLREVYPCYATTYYWRSKFVPHPKIWGAVGMKLATLSRYHIKSARRVQLPVMPGLWWKQQFELKRAVLDVEIASESKFPLHVLNTHLDAFAQGTDTMRQQVERIAGMLATYDYEGIPWILGGDFNLLPNREAFDELPEFRKSYYNSETELNTLIQKYQSVPDTRSASNRRLEWRTHFPNDPRVKAPDSIIDYLFVSPKVEILRRRVRQDDTFKISDHFPVIGELLIKEKQK